METETHPDGAVGSTSEYRFRSELSPALTIVVRADSEDHAKEELARIGLHPFFFELVERE